MKFVLDEFFVRRTDGIGLRENYRISEVLPMQIVYTSKLTSNDISFFNVGGIVKMERAAEKGMNIMIYLVVGNIALQLLM